MHEFDDTPMAEVPSDRMIEVSAILSQAQHASSFDKIAILHRALQLQGEAIRDMRREQATKTKPWWKSMTIVSTVAGYVPKLGILGVVLWLIYRGMSPDDAVAHTQSMVAELSVILGLLGLDKLASAFTIAGRFRAGTKIQ